MGGPVPIHIIKGDGQCFVAYFDIIEKSLENGCGDAGPKR
jgi:hypothetical protein